MVRVRIFQLINTGWSVGVVLECGIYSCCFLPVKVKRFVKLSCAERTPHTSHSTEYLQTNINFLAGNKMYLRHKRLLQMK